MDYIEMRQRPNGEIVRVYQIFQDMNNVSALIFIPSLHQKQNNGWQKIKMSKLVPIDMPLEGQEMTSKTKKNKAKSLMKLVDATWLTTDGETWKHEELEDAIEHQINLMEENKQDAE